MLTRNLFHIISLLVYVFLSTSSPVPTGTGEEQGEEQHFIPAEPFNPTDYENAELLLNASMRGLLRVEGTEDTWIEDDITFNVEDAVDEEKRVTKLSKPVKPWPKAVMPYIIGEGFSQDERAYILQAMKNLQKGTCISFRSPKKQEAYLKITKLIGNHFECNCELGYQGKQTTMKLTSACFKIKYQWGTVEHELMHGLGFYHTHQREDRDKYLNLNWKLIKNAGVPEHNYYRVIGVYANSVKSSKFDFGSMMMYPAINGLTAKNSANEKLMGQRRQASTIDYDAIRKFYKSECKKQRALDELDNDQDCTDKDVINCQHYTNCTLSYVAVNCKKSCGECGVCRNFNENCDAWAMKAGYCQKYHEYMQEYCPQACAFC